MVEITVTDEPTRPAIEGGEAARRARAGDRMMTVTLDRETRDLVIGAVLSYDTSEFESFDSTLRGADRAEIMAQVEKISWICGLRDQLGWGKDGDRASYSLTADDRLREWAPRYLADVRNDLRCDEASLCRILAGCEEWYVPGKPQEESAGFDRQRVERDLRKIELLEALIDQVGLLEPVAP